MLLIDTQARRLQVEACRPTGFPAMFRLPPELDGFIIACLASGDYGNASEVIRTALKLLRGKPQPPETPWPVAGGECGALIRQRNWSTEPIGPVEKLARRFADDRCQYRQLRRWPRW